VHVDWLMTNDVTSRSVFTLKEAGQFVDFNSETTATTTYAVYVNSSAPVLVATLNELQSDVPPPGRTRYCSLSRTGYIFLLACYKCLEFASKRCCRFYFTFKI